MTQERMERFKRERVDLLLFDHRLVIVEQFTLAFGHTVLQLGESYVLVLVWLACQVDQFANGNDGRTKTPKSDDTGC